MNEHLNPDYPNRRGCFIDRFSKAKESKILVVDYPTWHLENDIEPELSIPYPNSPIPAGQPNSREFDTLDDARAFAAAENYVICTMPRKLDPNRCNKPRIVYEPNAADSGLAES